MNELRPVTWVGGIPGTVRLLDQRRLPAEEVYLNREAVEDLFRDIQTLAVRGAPAIGVAAAFGVVLGAQTAVSGGAAAVEAAARAAAERLAVSRPTAVNLFVALDRMVGAASHLGNLDGVEAAHRLLTEARAFFEEDLALCRAIGRHGAGLVPDGGSVLTHCNAGALATSGYGTALGVLYAAQELGKTFSVYCDETRPLLQGARLTAWELARAGLQPVVLCDNAAGWALAQGRISMVIVGADRIAANGDTANKIGTYPLAVLARRHRVDFHVAAPSTTFDLTLVDGKAIPIEERAPDEVFTFQNARSAPEGIGAFNPAFDVTPAELITSIVTEFGVISNPDTEKIRAQMGG